MRNKMAKRSIAVILSLVLALSGLPVFGNVEAKAAVGDTFTVDGKAGYKILFDDNERKYAELSWMEDTLTDGINLPDTVNYNGTEYVITEIGGQPFLTSELAGTLKLPSKLKVIGYEAFYGMRNLVGDLKLPDTLIVINERAFWDCTGLTGELKIPGSVTSIGARAFQNCPGFAGDLNIPNSVTSIGGSAFEDCVNLNGTLTIPASVTSIGSDAFKNMHPDIIINNSNIDLTTKGIDFTNYTYYTQNVDAEGNVLSYSKAVNASRGTYYIKKTFNDNYIVEMDTSYIPTAKKDDQTISIKPKVIVKETSTSEPLFEGVDYDIYPGFGYWGAAETSYFTVGGISSGKGRYFGQVTNNGSVFEYKIYGDISSNDLVTVQRIPDQMYQSGTAIEPEPTIYCYKNGEKITLTQGVDYEIVSYENNTNPGTAKIRIKGIGDFVNERIIRFNIVNKNKNNTRFGSWQITDPKEPVSADSSWSGSYVFFGTYDSDMTDNVAAKSLKYRVLSANKKDYNSNYKTLLLDCDSVIKEMKFDDVEGAGNGSNKWENSNIYKWLNDENNSESFINTSLSQLERDSIVESYIAERNLKTSAGVDDDLIVSTDTKDIYKATTKLNGEKIFLLDVQEVSRKSFGYGIDDDNYASRTKYNLNGVAYTWWLRSAKSGNTAMIGTVYPSGSIETYYVNFKNVGVSPAFNVDTSKIVFSSLIESGDTYKNYKLTLKDDNLSIGLKPGTKAYSLTPATSPITKIVIPYVVSGDYNQISVVITRGEWGKEDTDIILYEPLSIYEDLGTEGLGTFNLPGSYNAATDKIYIIAERINDADKTDYASKPIEIDHYHRLSVIGGSSSGKGTDTITVKCDSDGCDYEDNTVSVTISAPVYRIYNESGSYGANVTCSSDSVDFTAYGLKEDVFYYNADDAGNIIGEKLDSVPKNAGNYFAELVYSGEVMEGISFAVYAHVVYKIDKADLSEIDIIPYKDLPCNTKVIDLKNLLDEVAASSESKGKYTINNLNQNLVIGNNIVSLTFTPKNSNYNTLTDVKWNVNLNHFGMIHTNSSAPEYIMNDADHTVKIIDTKSEICDICGETLDVETTTTNYNEDHYNYLNAMENETTQSCTQEGGYDIVWYCICGKEISREHVDTGKLQHTSGTRKINEVDSTCSEVGHYDLETYCTECGAQISIEQKEIAKKAHTPGDWDIVKQATATEAGKKVKKCTVCGDVVEEEVIPAAGSSSGGSSVPGGSSSGGSSSGGSSVPGGSSSGGSSSGGSSSGGSSSGGSTVPGGSSSGGSSSGGSTGGSSGGSTGGSAGGSTGGSVGGSTGGSAGGSTGGSVGGSTGGSTGGATGGSTSGGSTGTGATLPKAAEVGALLTDKASNATYKVTSSGKKNTVEYVSYDGSATKVTIPDSIIVEGITYKVTAFAAAAFKKNTKITSITIGDNITKIPTGAFAGCTKLKKVEIGSGVTTIGQSAFKNCKALTSLTIPEGVKYLRKGVFTGCSSLKKLVVRTTLLTDKTVTKGVFKSIPSKCKVYAAKTMKSAYAELFAAKGLSSKINVKATK